MEASDARLERGEKNASQGGKKEGDLPARLSSGRIIPASRVEKGILRSHRGGKGRGKIEGNVFTLF